jgi:hypothetical protein
MRQKKIILCWGALLLFSLLGSRIEAQDACAVPSKMHPDFTAAIEAKSLGQHETAISHMERCIKDFRGSPAPYYLLGNWFWEEGNRGKAKENWKLARSASPG